MNGGSGVSIGEGDGFLGCLIVFFGKARKNTALSRLGRFLRVLNVTFPAKISQTRIIILSSHFFRVPTSSHSVYTVTH